MKLKKRFLLPLIFIGLLFGCKKDNSKYTNDDIILPANANNQGKIVVKNGSVTICLRDFGTIDGDICDIQVNGITYVTNYMLTGTDSCFKLSLPMGESWIGVIAKSEGLYPPCTAGVTITDGISSQQFSVGASIGSTIGAYIIDVEP